MGRAFAGLLALLLGLSGIRGHCALAQLSEGVDFEAVYTIDLAANVSGGIDRGVRYLDNLDLALTVDSEPLVGWSGTTLFLYGLGNQGGSVSELAGDAQGVSNIEAPTAWRLYEAWIEHVLPGKRISILAGLYDLNSEFDVNWTGSLFINSSHGIGAEFSQSGRNGPSIFPVTSLGVRARASFANRLILKAALLDGVPGDPNRPRRTHIAFDDADGLLIAAEGVLLLGGNSHWNAEPSRFRLASRTDEVLFQARVVVGAWRYTAGFDELRDPRIMAPRVSSHRNQGLYALAEWNLLRERDDAAQGLSAFTRTGLSNDRVNRFASYAGLGLVYTGLVPRRDEDQAGIAVAVARNGDPYFEAVAEAGTPDRSEVVIEATYVAGITSWLSLQADLQYIINPDTNPLLSNAIVPLLRLQIEP